MLSPSSGWRQRQQGPLKGWYPNTALHGVTNQKNSTWIFTTVKISNLSSWLSQNFWSTFITSNLIFNILKWLGIYYGIKKEIRVCVCVCVSRAPSPSEGRNSVTVLIFASCTIRVHTVLSVFPFWVVRSISFLLSMFTIKIPSIRNISSSSSSQCYSPMWPLVSCVFQFFIHTFNRTPSKWYMIVTKPLPTQKNQHNKAYKPPIWEKFTYQKMTYSKKIIYTYTHTQIPVTEGIKPFSSNQVQIAPVLS
jgi:hypothetical protein